MRIAVALYLYDAKLVAEYTRYLSFLPRGYSLFITAVHDHAIIARAFPNAKRIKVENRGMDIGGFLAILPYILTGDYDVVLKLHSKSSKTWRTDLLTPVCGSPQAVNKCLRMFSDPSVGMVGAQKWLLTPKTWKCNTYYLKMLSERFQQPLQQCSFIGGSIFWMRVTVLKRMFNNHHIPSLVQELNTSTSLDWNWYRMYYADLTHLTEEQIREHWIVSGKKEGRVPNGLVARSTGLLTICDGMLEHAYERLFALRVVAQGLVVTGVVA